MVREVHILKLEANGLRSLEKSFRRLVASQDSGVRCVHILVLFTIYKHWRDLLEVVENG
jgi:hypothetical protein